MTDERIVKDAVYIIDDRGMRSRQDPQSGWDYDDRGAVNPPDNLRGMVLCTGREIPYGVSMKREFLPLRGGKSGFTAMFTLHSGDDFFLEFYGLDGKSTLAIRQKNGMFYCGSEMLPVMAYNKSYCIAVNFNLDAKNAEVLFFGKLIGTYPLTNTSLARVKFGYPKEADGCAVLHNVHMFINYLVCDTCENTDNGDMPYGWRSQITGNAFTGRTIYYEGQNLTTYYISAAKYSSAKVIREFDKASGNVCFELKYLTKTDNEKVSISLCSGDIHGVTIIDDGTKSETADGTLIRKHGVYVWQTIRIEADTTTGKALIKHNGKKCGIFDFSCKCDSFDRIEIGYAPENGGVLKFVDAFVFVIQPEPDDYVPTPVLPDKKDYIVGMNICSLWRNGDHWGWDVISPYDENKTYMGYYDEGLPEVADWEIKWMLEHGLDFELYCWYNNQTTAPICKTGLSAAIHGGHFNAKYGDMMKFAIIWEAANCSHASAEQFEKYVVPYWIDYFFTDPRYMTINNKLVISIFGISRLMKDFGSAEGVRKEFDYLRNVAKSLGFDGVIFMSCSGPSPEVVESGSDAIYAYNWGKSGYDGDFTKAQITGQIEKKAIHVIPTVSVGFNNVAWAGTRSPMMTNETMGDVLEWFKNDVLPKNEGDDWKRKFVMFSTWNEYGEGTYICPSDGNGFGYLDEMRKAFTNEKQEHTDLRPNEHQLSRLGYLYPKGRSLLRAQFKTPPVFPTKVESSYPITPESIASWTYANGLETKLENGVLSGQGKQHDPQILTGITLDADKVGILRMKMRTCGIDKSFENTNSAITEAHLFFTTDKDSVWNEAKGVAGIADGKGYIYFFVNNLVTWNGTITDIRIDPTDGAGKFELEGIDILMDENKFHITIDGVEYLPNVRPIMAKDNIYLPFEPQRGFCTLTKTYHTWDKATRTVTLECAGKLLSFTENCDVITVDGKEKKLAGKLEFSDGLPMLPLKEFCEITGFKYILDGQNLAITTK